LTIVRRSAPILALVAVLALTFAIVTAVWGQVPLTPGGTARVDATADGGSGSCVNLREVPTTVGNTPIRCVQDFTIVTVLEGSEFADGLQWQRVQAGTDIGWMAAVFLVPLSGTSTPTPSPSPTVTATPPPSGGSGSFTGSLPASGGIGLVVWGGGTTQNAVIAAVGQGCSPVSMWVTDAGQFIGYAVGAPTVVNLRWNQRFPGSSIPAGTPMIVVCSSGATSPPPSGGTPAPTPPPSSGPLSPPVNGTPPGPAGNP